MSTQAFTCTKCGSMGSGHAHGCPELAAAVTTAITDADSKKAKPIKAHEFLEAGIGHMKDRAATYDAPDGERSMAKTVDMFRALTGIEMSEEQGWKFMCCLKLVRSEQGKFRADNFEDLGAYAGLAGEAASKT